MSKNTPGPWNVENADENVFDIVPDDSIGGTVAIAYDEENAKLIAAAPELLEALRKAEFRLAKLIALNDEEPGIASPDDAVALEQVRSAIAKAEGRSWEAARTAIDAATR